MTAPSKWDWDYGLEEYEVELEITTLDRRPETFDFNTMMNELNARSENEVIRNRILAHALQLFERLANDKQSTYDGIPPISLFCAALDTAMVWEFG